MSSIFKRVALFGLILVLWVGASVSLIALPRRSKPGHPLSASAIRQTLQQFDAERASRIAALKRRLLSTKAAEFGTALDVLSKMDEPGALDAWSTAIATPDDALKRQAWTKYLKAWPVLSRRQSVPQIVRINTTGDEVSRTAADASVDLQIWSSQDGVTYAAISPYSLDRLRIAGLNGVQVYDSIVDLQQASRGGDALAQRLTTEHNASEPISQVRIAVIDLSRNTTPDPGYSNWAGDAESILMRTDHYMAYLDVFVSDGSADSLSSHEAEKYTKHGYQLAGLFTPEEFSTNIARFFPGKTFNPGSGLSEQKTQSILPELANGKFHSYDQSLAEFTALAQAHPDLAKLVNIGKSFEGRQLFGLKITSNPDADVTSKPDVLVTGCHHAREWISVEPPMYFANQLISGYTTDDTIKYLVDHLQVWIFPVANPDGLTFSQGVPNDQLNGQREWRKNRRPVSVSGCGSATGVDLNRNYSYQWRLEGDQPCPFIADDNGASDNPSDETFRGPSPESELEVQALDAFTGDPNKHFVARLDYHNFSELVLYPWGYTTDKAPDSGTLGTLSQKMVDLGRATGGPLYTAEQSIDLYITTGSSTDYAYEHDKVAVPITVELRPTCCDFNVPENLITPINVESWAGAEMLMEWAAGPPILQSVDAFQNATDGTLTKPIYSAHWADTVAGRQLVVGTHFPVLLPGPVKVRLQFSKPMDPTNPPAATLGRTAPFTELTFAANGPGEGWQRTAQQNDTWIGEVTLPDGGQSRNAWRLAVGATDTVPLNLDGNPATVAAYAVGTGGWANYEDGLGPSVSGGIDTRHIFAPTVSGNIVNLTVDTPTAGERLGAGDAYTVAWTIPQDASFTPADGQQIWLSTDSGQSFNQIASGIPGTARNVTLPIPVVATTGGRLEVVTSDVTTGNLVIGASQADFTIGLNVGGALTVNLLSAQLINQGWTDTSSASGPARFLLTVSLTNQSQIPIANPFFRVSDLTRNNILLSRDGNSLPSIDARQSVSPGSNIVVNPGQSVQAQLLVGLLKLKKFDLDVIVYGVPMGGAVPPSDPVLVWHGRPQ